MVKRIALALLILLLGWLIWEWIGFPDVRELAENPPETTAFMERRKQELRRAGESDEIRWEVVPYSRISRHLRRAVLVSEDSAFYEHEGVDVEGMKEALKRNWENRKLSHGGSTITQQLAKNLYLSPSRNPVRKIKEYFITRALEKHLTKKRILELYLNVVELGERVYGAEAGARHYFGKSAASLTPSEAALLAGSLPNPRRMKPDDPNARLRARQKIILSRMRRWGHLAEQEVMTGRKPAEEPELVEEPPPSETIEPPGEDVESISPDEVERIPPAEPLPPDDVLVEPHPIEPEPPPTNTAPPPAEEPPPAVTELVVPSAGVPGRSR